MIATLNSRRQRRSERDDSGLALLDVLLGMAIFALIVIIAIQAVGLMRQRAFYIAGRSDTRQVSQAIEVYMLDNQKFPTLDNEAPWVLNPGQYKWGVLPPSFYAETGVNLTKGMQPAVVVYRPDRITSGEWGVCVYHKSGSAYDAWHYWTANQGFTASGKQPTETIQDRLNFPTTTNTARPFNLNCRNVDSTVSP